MDNKLFCQNVGLPVDGWVAIKIRWKSDDVIWNKEVDNKSFCQNVGLRVDGWVAIKIGWRSDDVI